jgi:hypothetical protein
VAYDEELAGRIRELAEGEPGLSEKRLFGGLAFLVAGNMAVVASAQGGIMVRVDPEQSGTLTKTTAATPAVMRGREMRGWLRLAAADVSREDELAAWAERGIAYARSLPPK